MKKVSELKKHYNSLPQMRTRNIKLWFNIFFWPGELKASSIIKGTIAVSSEWAAQLISNPSEETKNAFLLTLGHELGHKDERDFSTQCSDASSEEDKRFICWTNEVRHDFYSAQIMVDCDQEKAIKSIKYKIQMKPDDEDRDSHPSWKRRLEYAKTGTFDSNLIQKIADDTGCKNEELISKVCEFYKEPIKLI